MKTKFFSILLLATLSVATVPAAWAAGGGGANDTEQPTIVDIEVIATFTGADGLEYSLIEDTWSDGSVTYRTEVLMNA